MEQNKIILKSVYGSHLFGMETPTSDRDYYVIFQADLKDIVLGKAKDCWTEDGNNTQHKELRRFIYDAMVGQTYAIELLFSPSKFWKTSSPEWEYLVKNRVKLVSKNLRPFLGYALGQAKKYSAKVTTFKELEEVVVLMKKYKLSQLLRDVEGIKYTDNIYTKTITLGNNKEDKYIRFFHREYPLNAKLSVVVPSIQKYLDEYGDRTRLFASKQYDCKAMSHALRLCYILDELMITGSITYPVINRDYLMRVKLGVADYDEIQVELQRILNKIDTNLNVLPDEPDREFWNDFIVRTYLS